MTRISKLAIVAALASTMGLTAAISTASADEYWGGQRHYQFSGERDFGNDWRRHREHEMEREAFLRRLWLFEHFHRHHDFDRQYDGGYRAY